MQLSPGDLSRVPVTVIVVGDCDTTENPEPQIKTLEPVPVDNSLPEIVTCPPESFGGMFAGVVLVGLAVNEIELE